MVPILHLQWLRADICTVAKEKLMLCIPNAICIYKNMSTCLSFTSAQRMLAVSHLPYRNVQIQMLINSRSMLFSCNLIGGFSEKVFPCLSVFQIQSLFTH